MTKEQKLVALCAFLPVLGDFIEDLNDQYVFKQGLKRKANILLDEIQRIDARVLRGQFRTRKHINKLATQ